MLRVSAYVSVCQHTGGLKWPALRRIRAVANSAYASIRQHTSNGPRCGAYVLVPTQRMSAYVSSVCQRMSAYVSVCQRMSAYVSEVALAYVSVCQRGGPRMSAYVSEVALGCGGCTVLNAYVLVPTQRMSAYVSVCQRMSAYVSVCQHTGGAGLRAAVSELTYADIR